MNTPHVAVVVFGGRRLPRPLAGLTVIDSDDIDAALSRVQRLTVVGVDADLAAVLTRLLRAERLDIEIAYVSARRTAATRAYRLATGWRAARRAVRASAQRVPLLRDETGSAIVGVTLWQPPDDEGLLRGEAVVDDTVLFDGEVSGVRVEPTAALPGLRARVTGGRWVSGRAAQLGSTGVAVIRDGVAAPRTARRSTVYRNTEGWLSVR